MEKIIIEYKNAPWDFDSLSINPNIDFDSILTLHKNGLYIIRLDLFIQNKNFKVEYLNTPLYSENIQFIEVRENLSRNVVIRIKDIIDTETILGTVFESESILDKFLECSDKWLLSIIFQNLNEDPKVISKIIKTFEGNSVLSNFSSNYNLTPEIIEQHPEIEWSWYELSANPMIDINFVLKNLDKPWDWNTVTKNIGITYKDILNYPNLPWSEQDLVSNIYIDDEILISSKNWETIDYSANFNLTIKSIKKISKLLNLNIAEDWDWSVISCNPFVTIEDILEIEELYPSLSPVLWLGYSNNPNLSIDEIRKYYNLLNFKSISSNYFYKDIELYDILPKKFIGLCKHFYEKLPYIQKARKDLIEQCSKNVDLLPELIEIIVHYIY